MKEKTFEQWLTRLSKNHNLDKKVHLQKSKKNIKKIFLKFRKKLWGIVGKKKILWMGSSALGLLGRGEFDLYLVVTANEFKECLNKLSKYYKAQESEKGRTRYNLTYCRNKIEIELVTEHWLKKSKNADFFKKLKSSKKLRKEYEQIKSQNTKSKRDYFRAKNAFIEQVLKN